MPDVKFLHCADLHIGAAQSFLGLKAKQRQNETLLTFERIIKLAKEESVKFVLIAGDLLDSNNVEFSFFNRIIDCISEANQINFIFAAGNHDPLDFSSPFLKYKLPSNLYVFGTADSCFTFNEEKVRIYGRSFKEVYCEGENEFTLSPADDDFINIMCIHGDFSADSSVHYNPISRDFIKNSGMNYIALGHIHKRSEAGKIGNVTFSYCGCPEGQGFDESGEKGVYIVEISKENVELSFVNTAFRTHIRETVDISGCSSSAEAGENILNMLKNKYSNDFVNNLYRITLTGEIEENSEISAEEIATRLNEQVYFAKVKDKTQVKYDLDVLKDEPSLKGIFVKNMLEKIENANESEKHTLEYALNLGLKAFVREVTFNEN